MVPPTALKLLLVLLKGGLIRPAPTLAVPFDKLVLFVFLMDGAFDGYLFIINIICYP